MPDDIIEIQKKMFRQQLSVFYMLRDEIMRGNRERSTIIIDEIIRATKDCLKQ